MGREAVDLSAHRQAGTATPHQSATLGTLRARRSLDSTDASHPHDILNKGVESPESLELSTELRLIPRTLLTLIWTLLTRLGVIPRTLLTNLIVESNSFFQIACVSRVPLAFGETIGPWCRRWVNYTN
jgi:hypothetical protein